MVKVTFDYGNKEDHKLVQEMIGVRTEITGEVEGPKTIEERVRAEKTPKPEKKEPAAAVSAEVESSAPETKKITADEALPLVAGYCQKNGLDKPQAFFTKVGKKNIHELTPAELNELLAELEIEV